MNTTDDAPTASDYVIVNLARKGADTDSTPEQVFDAATRVYFATGCPEVRSLMFAYDGSND